MDRQPRGVNDFGSTTHSTVSTLHLHLTSLRSQPHRDPFLRCVPFLWAIAPIPSLSAFLQRFEGPTVVFIVAILLSLRPILVGEEVGDVVVAQFPFQSWETIHGVFAKAFGVGGAGS